MYFVPGEVVDESGVLCSKETLDESPTSPNSLI